MADPSRSSNSPFAHDLGSLGQVTSFGLGPDGELLYTTFEGVLGRIVPER